MPCSYLEGSYFFYFSMSYSCAKLITATELSAYVWCELSFVIMQIIKLETSADVVDGKLCEKQISEVLFLSKKRTSRLNF
jgi:hypothetical protein